MFDECTDTEGSVVVKEEIVVVESNLDIKTEFYDESEYNYDYSSTYVQACYDNNNEGIKEEYTNQNVISPNRPTTVVPENCVTPSYLQSEHTHNILINAFRKHRTLSPYSAKCRTRALKLHYFYKSAVQLFFLN